MNLVLPPLVAEPIFNIGSFPVTNSYINSTLAVVLFFIIGLLLRNKTHMVPKGIQNFFEAVLEFMLGYIDRITHSREKSLRFLPLVGGIFLFILVSNWMGLLPGTGSIGRYLEVHGQLELVPLLRPANADLNMTVAMALFSVFVANLLGAITVGVWRHVNRFIKIRDVVRSFNQGKTSIMVAFIEFGVGFLEIISEIAKVISLSLRLFGNIFAGEVLLTVIAGMLAFVLPLPFMFLEILVGLVQAIVFSMLTLVYFALATQPIEDKAHH